MKVLIIGSGAREHALVKAVKRSPRVTEVLAAPGNDGIAAEARCLPISVDRIGELADAAEREKVDFTFVGPELPLTAGIVDTFKARGLRILGPSQAAAELEASKIYTKDFLKKYKIPTARYEVFSDAAKAKEFLRANAEDRWVVKADGLAAGKGVIVAANLEEAIDAVDRILSKKEFGEQRLVIEEFLDGEELSFMVLCDGIEGIALASSQDHKRLHDGDEGPNTGGMGAYSPAPLMDEKLSDEIMKTIVATTLAGMREEGRPFTGVLYAGLMIVGGKPLVLEFNVRFGDPEAEVLLPRLKTDWMDLFEAAESGDIAKAKPEWSPQSAVGVVIAASGYPQDPRKGDSITGLEAAAPLAWVCHGGTKQSGGQWLSNGGRVLTLTALGDDLADAVKKCYQAVEKVNFAGAHYRRDIAAKGLKRIKNGNL